MRDTDAIRSKLVGSKLVGSTIGAGTRGAIKDICELLDAIEDRLAAIEERLEAHTSDGEWCSIARPPRPAETCTRPECSRGMTRHFMDAHEPAEEPTAPPFDPDWYVVESRDLNEPWSADHVFTDEQEAERLVAEQDRLNPGEGSIRYVAAFRGDTLPTEELPAFDAWAIRREDKEWVRRNCEENPGSVVQCIGVALDFDPALRALQEQRDDALRRLKMLEESHLQTERELTAVTQENAALKREVARLSEGSGALEPLPPSPRFTGDADDMVRAKELMDYIAKVTRIAEDRGREIARLTTENNR